MIRTFVATLLICAPLALSADVLILDEVRQVESMALPINGLSKADVEAKFGTPREKHNAVGNPPITRWDYESYSVYFEYDLVLYTVLRPGEVINSA
ncbi:hypothetical protein F3N42_02170 [Marinihelvus fidelis]|uniref:Outer membrane protein assembly factor BamE n=1 Tax=Marinihelvus fidelis TaxID=2613842 RepID=A0A5N0TH46_9GAMM|nr:hypothetical protein [Marinihelvus fidelis]KAA9133186.1 hypothetical protein F3N42_02170 [Marinihelvus fidelis]